MTNLESVFYVVLGISITTVLTYFTTKISSNVQIKIHTDALDEDRIKAQIILERIKLEELHQIISIISFENSITMSNINSSESKLEDFRSRYMKNTHKLYLALAISDMYFPNMSSNIRVILSSSNVFWGHQEGVIRTDSKNNPEGWKFNLEEVIKTSKKISKDVRYLQEQISQESALLTQKLLRNRI